MSADGRRLQLALAVSLGVFVVLGLPDGVLGTVWPTLRDDLGRRQSGFGQLIAGFSLGYTAASLASGHVSERLGVGRSMQLATTTSALGLIAVAAAPGWWTVVAGFAVLGAGNGGIDAVLNAWVALTRGPRAMGLLHAAYGLGATLGPLLATAFVTGSGSWRGPFVVICCLQLAAVVAVTRLRHALDDAPIIATIVDASPPRDGSRRLVVLMILWFTAYVGAEATIGQWSFTLLTEDRGVAARTAGLLVASYWAGLTIGRLALGIVGHRIRPERVLVVTTFVSIVATAVFWADPGSAGQYALPVIGLAFSVMFPIVVNRTPVYLGADRAGRVVGYQLAASALGFTVLPYVVGILADRRGVGVTAPIAFAAVVAMAVLLAAMLRTVAVGSGVGVREQSGTR